jgi:hypothetical protein
LNPSLRSRATVFASASRGSISMENSEMTFELSVVLVKISGLRD